VKGSVVSQKPETTDPWAMVENRYYKMQLDRTTGAIAQLVDKQTGQNLVDPNSGHGLNEYLYVTGGGDHTPLFEADPTLPLPKLTVHQQTVVGIPQITNFPWGIQVMLHTKSENTPQIVTTITLNKQQKRVSIQNEVQKTETIAKEGVYFAFPFAVEKPQVEIQGPTAWVNPETDMLPGAGRQSFVTQGGVRIQGANQSIGWVSVDAPLLTLGDINKGLWPESTTIRNGSIFSYVMNNYWTMDTPAKQGGNFVFRYVLTSGTDMSLSGMGDLTEEARTPLYAIRHSHKNWEQPLSAEGANFLGVSDGVHILTIRPTADNRNYLIRVQNTTDQPLAAHLNFPLVQLENAYLSSVLGDKVESVQWTGHGVDLSMKKNDVKTIVVRVQDESAKNSKGQ
jgi:alpha-mannosidase